MKRRLRETAETQLELEGSGVMTGKCFKKKIKELLLKKDEINSRLQSLYCRACRNPPPLRQAVSGDIIPGNLIWYKYGDFLKGPEGVVTVDYRFVKVAEVMAPSDDWKAFVDNEGARRGLFGALVEK